MLEDADLEDADRHRRRLQPLWQNVLRERAASRRPRPSIGKASEALVKSHKVPTPTVASPHPVARVAAAPMPSSVPGGAITIPSGNFGTTADVSTSSAWNDELDSAVDEGLKAEFRAIVSRSRGGLRSAEVDRLRQIVEAVSAASRSASLFVASSLRTIADLRIVLREWPAAYTAIQLLAAQPPRLLDELGLESIGLEAEAIFVLLAGRQDRRAISRIDALLAQPLPDRWWDLGLHMRHISSGLGVTDEGNPIRVNRIPMPALGVTPRSPVVPLEQRALSGQRERACVEGELRILAAAHVRVSGATSVAALVARLNLGLLLGIDAGADSRAMPECRSILRAFRAASDGRPVVFELWRLAANLLLPAPRNLDELRRVLRVQCEHGDLHGAQETCRALVTGLVDEGRLDEAEAELDGFIAASQRRRRTEQDIIDVLAATLLEARQIGRSDQQAGALWQSIRGHSLSA